MTAKDQIPAPVTHQARGRNAVAIFGEETELLKHCPHHLATRVVMALDTGFRAAEIASIRWKGVDFTSREISVASGYTKNGESRSNPMTKRLTEMLTLLKGTNNVSPDDLLFGPYRYTKAFYKARDAAKLGKDVVFHTLRHTFISRLAKCGVPFGTIKELAGHKDIRMTMRYVHLAPEQKREAIDVLERVPTKIPTEGDAAFASG